MINPVMETNTICSYGILLKQETVNPNTLPQKMLDHHLNH